jgi:hypothetical protein
MRSVALLPAAFIILPLTDLTAQIPLDALSPGATVRVTVGEGAPAAWMLACEGEHVMLRIRGDTLELEGNPPLFCPLRWIEGLEIQRGQHGNGRTGALLGAAIIGAAGVVIAGADCNAYWGPCVSDEDAGTYRLGYGALGVVLGGTIGYAIGSGIRSDRWEQVLIARSQWP